MARRIYQDLKKYRIDIWFDNELLLPDQDKDFKIERAIEEKKYFIVLISSNSIDKVGYFQKEIKVALEKFKYYPKVESYIIPIRINDCKPIDEEIKELQYIDVFPENEYQNALKKNIAIC